jgi:mono/diheme cytochrome c family protein
MRRFPYIFCGVLPLAAVSAATSSPDYTRDIQPIFQKRCYVCHGPQTQMKGLRFDDRQAAMRVIAPGDSAHSPLIAMATGAGGKFMPPTGPRLSDTEIALLRVWVDQGAKWPDSAAKPGLWSLQPIANPAPPAVRDRTWPVNAIDQFILARLEAEKVAPSPPAERATLARRVSLDLTGLPLAPEEVRIFLADNRPDAYERLVDRLLASPHYGEKWARYWLDLAHYADSDGYEKDLERPWAWRYRKWVIDALNRDLPYDQFAIEQIAGDELPQTSVEQKVATGFYRQTLTNREGGVDRTEARFEELIDRTGTFGTVWLGMTVRCAQCHDHKYDPIKQKDFYQILAYFNRALEADVDAPLPGELEPYLAAKPDYDRKRAELLKDADVAALQNEWETGMRAAMDNPGKKLDWDFSVTAFRASFDHADRIMRKPAAERTERERYRLTNFFLGSTGPVISKQKETVEKLKAVRAKLQALDKTLPVVTQAYTIENDPRPPATHIALRGDYRRHGDEVQPALPSFLPPGAAKTRLDLAKWLVSPANPLVARVAVNRLWQEMFGRGIVATSEDFGTQGERPSHPDLLDYLATDFRDHGWSMKRVLRQVALSATYRQSSTARHDLESKDPANILLARQSRLRLTAELIRDQALAVSGLLDPEIGGKSIRPPQPAGVAELRYSNNGKWQESKGKERYRRGLYIHYQRTTPYPFLANFDEPDSGLSCARRRVSDTPLQSLNLLNDPVFFEAAGALAKRVEREAPGPSFDDRLNYAFELCLGRQPSALERDRLSTYFHQQQDWVGLSRVLLNLDEFISRE